MQRYSLLPAHLREMLDRIEPSQDGDILYYPCRVLLKDGVVLDTVYVEPEGSYLKAWGIYPEDDEGKQWIRIDDVVEIQSSPVRLPARFANEVYRLGESGMGYVVFKVVLADGQEQACVSGNAIDFIRYPPGKSPADVVGISPYDGPRDNSLIKGPPYYWCLYSEGQI